MIRNYVSTKLQAELRLFDSAKVPGDKDGQELVANQTLLEKDSFFADVARDVSQFRSKN